MQPFNEKAVQHIFSARKNWNRANTPFKNSVQKNRLFFFPIFETFWTLQNYFSIIFTYFSCNSYLQSQTGNRTEKDKRDISSPEK